MDQMIELGAFEGQRKTMAHFRQAEAHPACISHHGQGSEAALRGLGLNDRLHFRRGPRATILLDTQVLEIRCNERDPGNQSETPPQPDVDVMNC
jgi:hypothetical protein